MRAVSLAVTLVLAACGTPAASPAPVTPVGARPPAASVGSAATAHPSILATAPRPATPSPLAQLDPDTMRLTNGLCSGTDRPKLSVSPMRPEDFGIVVPYGLMVGNHVTPIDHQYFSPRDRSSAIDAYEVRAMADAVVTDIQARRFTSGPKTVEYRIHFAMSCKLIYYYDLVTVLGPKLQAALDQRRMGVAVKAGEVIGRIGGQTLDFAVWDMDVVLPGFVVREHYAYEPWKVHTVDPLPYYTDELRAFITSRYVRTAEPVSGKIDHDRDGRVVGNWFLEGTNGYRGVAQGTYWRGHLAIAPNHYDPTHIIVSLGDFGGTEAQFAVRGNGPDPAEVTVATGLVRYDLVSWEYTAPDGSPWDRASLIKGPRVRLSAQVQGCLLVQLVESRRMRAQPFPGRGCAAIPGFDGGARVYER